MKFRTLLMLVICAALTFGGSFTCTASNGGHPEHHDDNP
jgi:hypothetical protein